MSFNFQTHTIRKKYIFLNFTLNTVFESNKNLSTVCESDVVLPLFLETSINMSPRQRNDKQFYKTRLIYSYCF